MDIKRELALILESIAELSSLGYIKWYANVDVSEDGLSNVRILGISSSDSILIYENFMNHEEYSEIFFLLYLSDINFIYMTGFIEFE